MSIQKKVAQAVTGLIVSAFAAVAAGTWGFSEEKDLITAFAGFRLSVCGIGVGLSLLICLAFSNAWIGTRWKVTRRETGRGRYLNGIGFGLLPALMVWKVFEASTFLGRGDPVPEGFGADGLLIRNGLWMPSRAELLLAAALFTAAILWLVLRKESLPENGDLLGVTLGCYAACRMVTEGFRANQEARSLGGLAGWAAGALTLFVLGIWVGRAIRCRLHTGYAWACVPLTLASIVFLVLIQNGILSVGIPAVDLGMQAGFALLCIKSLCCMGRVTRNLPA